MSSPWKSGSSPISASSSSPMARRPTFIRSGLGTGMDLSSAANSAAILLTSASSSASTSGEFIVSWNSRASRSNSFFSTGERASYVARSSGWREEANSCELKDIGGPVWNDSNSDSSILSSSSPSISSSLSSFRARYVQVV